MQHRDALISEITVVVDATDALPFDKIVTALTAVGLQVSDTDPDDGELVGVIPANLLPEIRAVDGVKYVRINMEYIADYPVGDPRDLDGPETA